MVVYITTYFFVKNDAIRTNTISPTNPPLPNPVISAVRFATTSIPNTVPPVKTYQRIVTGIKAINNDPNPLKNPLIIETTFSIIVFVLS